MTYQVPVERTVAPVARRVVVFQMLKTPALSMRTCRPCQLKSSSLPESGRVSTRQAKRNAKGDVKMARVPGGPFALSLS